MSANSYTTSELIENVQLIAHMPLSQNTFTATQILNLANRELQTRIIKLIMSTRGGYYLTYEDQVARTDGLYPIPSAAISAVLANVEVVQNQNIIQVQPIEESEQFNTTMPSATSYGFFIRGNSVQILPVPTNGTVRLWFYHRPSALVATSAAAQVTAINGAIVTVSSLPSTMLVDTEVDALQDQPTFNILSERVIVDISGTDIELDEEVEGLEVGDWLALHEQTPIPQIPVEFRPLLEQMVVVKVYELQGYLDKMKAAQMKLSELEKDMTALITNRVKTKTKVVNSSTGGLVGSRSSGWIFPAGRES